MGDILQQGKLINFFLKKELQLLTIQWFISRSTFISFNYLCNKIIKIDRHQMVGKMYAQNYRIFSVGGKCTCSQHDPLIAD